MRVTFAWRVADLVIGFELPFEFRPVLRGIAGSRHERHQVGSLHSSTVVTTEIDFVFPIKDVRNLIGFLPDKCRSFSLQIQSKEILREVNPLTAENFVFPLDVIDFLHRTQSRLCIATANQNS